MRASHKYLCSIGKKYVIMNLGSRSSLLTVDVKFCPFLKVVKVLILPISIHVEKVTKKLGFLLLNYAYDKVTKFKITKNEILF